MPVVTALAVMWAAGVFHLKSDVEKVTEANTGIDAKLTSTTQEVRTEVRKSLDDVTASVDARFADFFKQLAKIRQNVSGTANRVASNWGPGPSTGATPTTSIRRLTSESSQPKPQCFAGR